MKHVPIPGSVEHALREFDEFIGRWLSPAVQRYALSTTETGPGSADWVRRAIRKLSESLEQQKVVGYGVYSRVLDHSGEFKNGYEYVQVSLIFERLEQAQNTHASCVKKHKGDFVILATQEMS